MRKLPTASLRTKFLIFSTLFILLPIVLTSLFFYYTGRNAILRTITDDNMRFAFEISANVKEQIFALKDVLKITGFTLSTTKDLKERREILIALDEGFIPIKSLSILNEEGKETIRSDDESLQDKRNNPEFYIAEKEGYYISGVELEKEESSITISISFLEELKFGGVLAAKINLYNIWDKIRALALGTKDSNYIFTKRGELVAKTTAFKEPFQLDLERIALNSAIASETVTQEMETKAGRMLKISTPIAGLDWQIVIFRPVEEIYKAINLVRNEIYITILLASVMAVIIAVFFSLSIINPIYQLYEGAGIIGKGNLNYRVDIRTGDEIEQLGKEFNQMAEDLKKSRTALEESKTTLEIKVEARTKELKELAEGMEAEVKRRTKEIQERMADLERFHQLAVGRELRMMELKQENKKLKEEMGKSKGRKK